MHGIPPRSARTRCCHTPTQCPIVSPQEAQPRNSSAATARETAFPPGRALLCQRETRMCGVLEPLRALHGCLWAHTAVLSHLHGPRCGWNARRRVAEAATDAARFAADRVRIHPVVRYPHRVSGPNDGGRVTHVASCAAARARSPAAANCRRPAHRLARPWPRRASAMPVVYTIQREDRAVRSVSRPPHTPRRVRLYAIRVHTLRHVRRSALMERRLRSRNPKRALHGVERATRPADHKQCVSRACLVPAQPVVGVGEPQGGRHSKGAPCRARRGFASTADSVRR